MTNVNCSDRERILRDAQPEELRALERHAADCAACGEELRAWREISAAAPTLRKSWESPDLWPRIHQALAEESQRARAREKSGWLARIPEWRPALAVLVLMAVSVAGAYLLMNSVPSRDPGRQVAEQARQEQHQKEETRLLTEQALRDLEASEMAYVASINRLARLAEPKIQRASSPLMLSYREKLIVLDAAIAELQAHIEQNRFNAYLRDEMLSLYREKQRTLQAVLREDQ
jgi:hypothetical protein